VITRQAGIVDLPQLVTLFDGYRQFYRQQSNLKATEAFIRERLQAQDSVFIITVTDKSDNLINSDTPGEGMGFTQLYPSFSSVAMQRTWILNDLYVAENYRQLGVATQLIESARTYAQQTNALAIKLATAVDNEQAKSLYNKVGFKKITEFDYYTLVTG